MPEVGGIVDAPTLPTPKPSMVQQVNAAESRKLSPVLLAKIEKAKFNTDSVVSPFFRCFLYGDIDAGKSYAAAKFGTPENVRIILTRQKEQLVALKGMGYKALHASTVELFRTAVMYPETIWPEWADLPDRTLVIDDITQTKDMLNDENSYTDQGTEIRDIRKISKGSKDDLRDMIQLSALGKPMNIIVTALERSWEVGNEVQISPDLPPAMKTMLAADFEYVLNIRKIGGQRILLTETSRDAAMKKDDKGKDVPYFVCRFARHKLPATLHGTGLVKAKEPADLRALWERVKSGKVAT
jgi:hypothetical protein